MSFNNKIIILAILFVLLLSFIVSGEQIPDYKNPELSIEERVEDLLSRMTLEEKIGQMAQAERRWISPEYVREFKIGSVLSGGGSSPYPNTPEAWVDMYNNFQSSALKTRLGIPLIYGVDSVHGHNNLKGATIFPHNIGLGAARDPELMKKIGEITAKETVATGVDWNFAPCVAVVRDIRWGRTYESYGENPELQRLLTASYIQGLQGPDNEMSGNYLVATAKHFLGDGGVEWGTGDANYKIDRGNVTISEEELRKIHLPGYIEAIEVGVGSVMASFNSYQGVKMHAHKYLLTDLLKNELGFDGFVVSDWKGIHEISAFDYYERIVKSVNAGVDMFMETDSWYDFINNLKRAVEVGDVSEDRINDAVRRILRVKFRARLFEEPYANKKLLRDGIIGSDYHREVAREAVRKSLVLLKNENKILPLSKDSKIYVGGSNADDIGNQCGGWTITWQGSSGEITEGITILEGIQSAVAGKGEVVSNLEQADVAVIVVGEKPYAEGMGDNDRLQLSSNDIEELKKVEKAGKPVIVIMVSGRPLMISQYIDNWDALVAAWLPGTEGDGVADVLFGDYNFTGKLPVSWPVDISQIPINYGSKNYDPLYEYGYGLKMELAN